MRRLARRIFTHDIVSDIKPYVINELSTEFSTVFFGDLWLSFIKSLLTGKLLISILVELLKIKKLVLKEFLTDPYHRIVSFYKILQVKNELFPTKHKWDIFKSLSPSS